jgi:hypothetical protein
VLVERLTTEGQIALDLVARHEQRNPDRIESSRAPVGRQITRIDLDAEQIAYRVAILALVEPPQRDATLLVADDFSRLSERLRSAANSSVFRSWVGCSASSGGIAAIELVEDFLPAIGLFNRLYGERDIVQPQLSFLLFCPVAFGTVILEKSAMGIIQPRAQRCCGGS